jgi:hypothetical protein
LQLGEITTSTLTGPFLRKAIFEEQLVMREQPILLMYGLERSRLWKSLKSQAVTH